MNRIVLVNGRAADLARAAILANDRGFTLGDGVFESLRVYGGRPCLLDRHIERLARGAELLRIPLPFTLAELSGQVEETLGLNRLESAGAYLRITLTRGAGERGLTAPAEPRPTLVVMALPIPAPPPVEARRDRTAVVAKGVRRNDSSPACRVKGLGQMENLLASFEAADRGADEAILLDTAGDLAEGSTTNLFWVSGRTIFTPSLACGVLPGITRAAVIELAAAGGVEVDEGRHPPARLFEADEAFLTSSLIEIEPLVRADGLPVGTGMPGPVTRSLMEAYREKVLRG